jgi:metallophosphoesterase (TIGR03767 family)
MRIGFMGRARTALIAAGLGAASLGVSSAQAEPAGQTSASETIAIQQGTGFRLLEAGAGEAYRLRQGRLGRASGNRANRRRSLLFFGQLTDPQIADEMSPVRLDFLDEAGSPVQDGLRPQETLDTQTFDQVVRNMNANRTSSVPAAGGERARLGFVINTGDMADSQMLHEVRNVVSILDGGTVEPFTGKQITDPATQCPNQDASTIARLNSDAAARNYTGLQDYDDYRGAPAARQQAFWDPDEAPPGGAGPYAGFPRYPGLLERAQRQFQAEGLDVPWYTSRGNHDGEITGNVPATFPIARALSVNCLKIFPGSTLDPNMFSGVDDADIVDQFADPQFQQQALSQALPVPPDPDRRAVATEEYKELHGSADNQHGYGFVNRRELRRSDDVAPYYAWSPNRRFRFISLDTVSDGGSQNGNIDNPQYKWLKRELDRNSRKEFRGNRLVRDRGSDRLIVLFGHHPLENMTSTASDESAGECSGAVDPGCDRDPRRSTPIHRGLEGRKNVRDLLHRYPNVIAFVNGHSHENTVTPRPRSGRKGGFWEINTASHVDWPQQSRQIEIMDNRDGTLSIFGTILDHAAPIQPPPFGTPAAGFTEEQLASISRVIAANDPQGKGLGTGDPGAGDRTDRNVELVIRNPKRLKAKRNRR